MSPTEHVIDERDEPFLVGSIKGWVRDPSGAALQDVVIEIRDQQGKIRGTASDVKGRFKLGDVSPGTYKFKVTCNGFQSIVGDIVLSKQAARKVELKLTMKVGV